MNEDRILRIELILASICLASIKWSVNKGDIDMRELIRTTALQIANVSGCEDTDISTSPTSQEKEK